ncbi:hypothetical protein KQY27_09165 [Methanobrevibacter sp. TMH8]|uniref:hypothetical protein n=1 Tax=Methanobrevibacter sp. TMH8 TaxID=2848611 RepID=UPI001CCEEB02|nr:hypothetical protein [Methanobrevibacter sp. TMH8]MBZ9571715.1 hypothetical protein [Methanobrevibacter sp. TMH8]
MELKDIYQNINWRSLILGAAIFAFIVILAIDYKLDFLLIFSSAGLLYIGYASRNRLQGIILGAIGTLPLGIATIAFQRLGPITGNNIEVWIIISFLAIGAFCGFTGSYFSSSRKKAIEKKMAQENIGKGSKKKNKENKTK